MMRLLFVPLCLLLARCQSATEPPVHERLALQLTFPRELAPQTRRFRSFLQRARSMEILLTTAAGAVTTRTVPPSQWSAVPLTAGPPGGADGFTVQARVWDTTREGVPRPFPVLTTPARRVTAAELQRNEPIPVHLRFSLHVSEREWE